MYQENITALKKDAPIGVFDSGIGGLTVAREIMREDHIFRRYGENALRQQVQGNGHRLLQTDCAFPGNFSGEDHRGGMQYGKCQIQTDTGHEALHNIRIAPNN